MPLRSLIVIFALLLAPLLVHAQCPGLTQQLTPYAKETLTISTTPKGFTASVYKPPGVTPALATFSIAGSNICYALVGTPTTTDCYPLFASPGSTASICGIDSITAFKAITLATDATVIVTYFKPRTP